MKLLSALKHIFIPHDKNDFKPHLFRELGVSIILFGSVFLLGSSFGTSFFMHKTVLGVEISSGVLIDLTNESRIAYNQPALVRNPLLDQAATLKGKDMAGKEYFSHDSPEGVTPWHWFRKVGYNFLYAGENLAINFTQATDVEDAWLKSPAHRANIMNVEFREIGLAVVEGVYQGYPTMYIVQMFGTPAYGKTVSQTGGDASLVHIKPSEKKAASPTVLAAANGNVKGDAVSAKALEVPAKTIVSNTSTTTLTATTTVATGTVDVLQKIITTPEIAIVKDTSASAKGVQVNSNYAKYSTWYQKVMFNSAYYVDIVYKILVAIIGIALIAMVVVEIRKQHVIHIMYGVSLILLLLAFIYINQSFL